MSSQQFQREEVSRGYMPQQSYPNRDPGTGVMGEPVNPLSSSAQAPTATSYPSVDPAASQGAAAGSRDPPISPTYDAKTPANATKYSRAPAGDFPSAQTPQGFSPTTNQSAAASQQPNAQTTSHSPYVQTASVPGSTGKTPMDSIMNVFNKWSKKAEDMTGNYWGHLRTGPNVADMAMGRLALGTRAISEGGLDNVFRQTFEVGPDEHLLKTYACYLSTSAGPVAGTLYISSHNLAFSSDRPLAIPQPPGQDNTTNQPTAGRASTPTGKHASSAQQQQQHQHCYYKVLVPISQVESVNPSENTQKKPPEKYVQVKTTDGHEFWFMGFVNYDKGVKNLQEAVNSKNATSPTNNTNTYAAANANANTNPPAYGDTNASTNAPSYGDAAYANRTTNPPGYNNTSYADGRSSSNTPSHGINAPAYADTNSSTNASTYGDASYPSRGTNPPGYGGDSYADSRPPSNPPSYDTTNSSYGDASYANPTTNPSAYGNSSYADNTPPSNTHFHNESSYPTDSRASSGPPSSYNANGRTSTGPPSYDDVNRTTYPTSHGNTPNM